MTSNEDRPPSRESGLPDQPEKPVGSSVPSPTEPDLRAFFKTLAASFAHSQVQRSERLAQEENPRSKGKGRLAPRPWLLPTLLAGLISVVLVWIGPLLLAGRELSVPDSLVGEWKTSARLYTDRGFIITKTSLVLKAGSQGKNVSVHPITRVNTAHAGGSTVYTIEYLVERAVYEFSFQLMPGPPPVIRLVHQPKVAWRKESGDLQAVLPKTAR